MKIKPDIVGKDTETSLIMPGVLAPPLVCATFADESGGVIAKHDDPELIPYTCRTLKGRTAGANFPFDAAVDIKHSPRLIKPTFDALHEGRVVDIQMNERLWDLQRGEYRWTEDVEGNWSRKSYSLGAIAWRRLRKGKVHDRHRLIYHRYRDLDLKGWHEDAKVYATSDAVLHREIALHQRVEHPDQAHQLRGHMALHLAACRGFRTDNNNVMKLYRQCEQWMKRIEPNLREAGLLKKNGKRDTKAAVRLMVQSAVERKNIEGLHITTSGEEQLIGEFRDNYEGFIKQAHAKGQWVSVSSASCLESGNPLLIQYGVYSKLSNMVNGAVKQLEAGTWLPIQTYFDPLMETGRTSSSGPNIQNVRRGINLVNPFDLDQQLKFQPDPRECFVAREGYVLLACDYHGAENHTLAQCCYSLFGFSKMADALNQGKDLHIWVASFILGCGYDEAKARYQNKDPEAKRARQLAKVANFGFPGGCGPARLVAFALSMGVDLDFFTAQELKNTWLDAYPELRKYFNHISSCETDDGWYYVNHVNSPRVRGKASFTAACNSYFQGLASDGAKAALWEATRRQWCNPQSALYGTYTVNFVHDEIILECPVRKLEAAARELQQVMVECFNRYTPDVPVSTSAEAALHWKKDMAPVFGRCDERGAIIPGTEDEFSWHEGDKLAS